MVQVAGSLPAGKDSLRVLAFLLIRVWESTAEHAEEAEEHRNRLNNELLSRRTGSPGTNRQPRLTPAATVSMLRLVAAEADRRRKKPEELSKKVAAI